MDSDTRSFLILHGWGGSGPEHWQTWLAGLVSKRTNCRMRRGISMSPSVLAVAVGGVLVPRYTVNESVTGSGRQREWRDR